MIRALSSSTMRRPPESLAGQPAPLASPAGALDRVIDRVGAVASFVCAMHCALLPIVFGVRIEALVALIIGLALYQASFISEVYRSGIQSVPKGHREAAQVLGLTPLQSFNRIVLPQAIRMTLPPIASNFVQLIKFSSLGAVISVSEITRRGMELSATNFRPLETFTFIAVVYFFICWPLAMAIRFWERRLQAR